MFNFNPQDGHIIRLRAALVYNTNIENGGGDAELTRRPLFTDNKLRYSTVE
jgi:hypothetical protein